MRKLCCPNSIAYRLGLPPKQTVPSLLTSSSTALLRVGAMSTEGRCHHTGLRAMQAHLRCPNNHVLPLDPKGAPVTVGRDDMTNWMAAAPDKLGCALGGLSGRPAEIPNQGVQRVSRCATVATYRVTVPARIWHVVGQRGRQALFERA
jgi:hypothetical protein